MFKQSTNLEQIIVFTYKNVQLRHKEKSKMGQPLNYNYNKYINYIKSSPISLGKSKNKSKK